jgi:hypothetical protein
MFIGYTSDKLLGTRVKFFLGFLLIAISFYLILILYLFTFSIPLPFL